MRFFILILFFFISISTKSQVVFPGYPSYDSVVTVFFDQYTLEGIPSSAELKFEKRPVGWLVSVIDYKKEPEIIKSEILWDLKKNKFRGTGFKKNKQGEKNVAEVEKFKSTWEIGFYNFCPYYGYAGWDWDVIQQYGDSSELPDSILYGVGRAFSSYAGNLLNNNSGFADASKQYVLANSNNCLSEGQLKEYRYYRHKAIEKFRRVEEMNPAYETIVGPIGQKTSNEHLTSFLDLRVYQNEKEAAKELTDSLYNDFYISVAKNYLNSCAPNAILFTNGDNDTYPLLYIQAQYGFRADILVVNISLLNTDRYINSLRDSVLLAPGLPLSFTPDEISGHQREVILIEEEKDYPYDLAKVINFLKDGSHKRNYGDSEYYYVPSNKFLLKDGEQEVAWALDKKYFTRNHLILLDVLNSNQWQRPVYFAITMANEAYFGLTDYFCMEGLAYRLISEKKNYKNDFIGSVNEVIMFENLMNKFQWQGFGLVTSHDKLLCMNYRNIFHRLADELIREDKLDSAKKVLDYCIALMPDEVVKYDYYMLLLIEDYYRLDEFEKANAIARKLAFNLKNAIDNYDDITIVVRNDNRKVIIQRLLKIAEDYGQDEIINLFKRKDR